MSLLEIGDSLVVPAGRVTALIGRNGMGKTTLVRSIMGLVPPMEGSIRFRGREIAGLAPERIARLGIGWVPQGRGVFPSLRVHENLRIAARPGKWTVARVHGHFPALKERARSWGDQLSGGEQQMLSIARALLANPLCLLMDEPFEGLAPAIVHRVLAVIREVAEEGTGVLLVEQQVAAALRVADHVYVMGKGRVVFDGTPAEFAQRPEIRSAYLGVS